MTEYVLGRLEYLSQESSTTVLPNQKFMEEAAKVTDTQQLFRDFLELEYDPSFYIAGARILEECGVIKTVGKCLSKRDMFYQKN